MTDNEIKKALAIHFSEDIDCDKCPYKSNDCMCSVKLVGDALDLINRLQEKIEKLKKAVDIHKGIADDLKYEVKRLEEIVGEKV